MPKRINLFVLLLGFGHFVFAGNISNDSIVTIKNSRVAFSFNLKRGNYKIINQIHHEEYIHSAFYQINDYASTDKSYVHTIKTDSINNNIGTGKKITIISSAENKPGLVCEVALYNNQGYLVFRLGINNNTRQEIRVKEITPLKGIAFDGFDFNEGYFTLDGESDGTSSNVKCNEGTVKSKNNLLVTFGKKGERKHSIVFGGLTYSEFQKFAKIDKYWKDMGISLWAEDPVGRLVGPETDYMPEDNFYIGVSTDNRFETLEKYGELLAIANNVNLYNIDFPILNLWYCQFGYAGNGEFRNNTPGAVQSMQEIKASGFLKYSKVGVRLEPDDYSVPNNQQGWWDDKHWQMYRGGQYIKPYETSEKWAKAIYDRGGVPFIYFQTTRRSQDFCDTYPEYMLFNESNYPKRNTNECLIINGQGEPEKWGYDFTDQGFFEHMQTVYRNLKDAGIKGVKFDYPDKGWAYEGGFEDKNATTAKAYRNIYELAYKGLGENIDVHERLGQGGDLTLGVTTTMRIEGDNDQVYPPMVSKAGLRWYKNRKVVYYDLDAKNPFHAVPEGNRDGVRAMFTMVYVVSGRLELGKYFSKLTGDQIYDLSRVVPIHTSPLSARPIDAFSYKKYPQVYDFEINNDWHQLVLYNTDLEYGDWPQTWPEYYSKIPRDLKISEITVELGDATDDGGLGLDKNEEYYFYDFWNNTFIGKKKGGSTLSQVLRPGEARVISIHKVIKHPQFISTNRHIMQGYLDMPGYPGWDNTKKILSGRSEVIGGETYKIILALNGYVIKKTEADGVNISVRLIDEMNNLAEITIDKAENGKVDWSVWFEQ